MKITDCQINKFLGKNYYCPTQREIAAYGRKLRTDGFQVKTIHLQARIKQILAKRAKRVINKTIDPLSIPLSARINPFLIRTGQKEIAARNIDTPTGWGTAAPTVTDRDLTRRLWVLHAEYKYHYSNRFGDWWTGASYLCGWDEQYFAVRLPRTITNIDDALAWLTPAPIRHAREKGLPVRRQGDIFFRPVRIADHDMSAIRFSRHQPHPRKSCGLTIVHPQHRPVILSGKYRWRAYQSSQINGNSRVAAD